MTKAHLWTTFLLVAACAGCSKVASLAGPKEPEDIDYCTVLIADKLPAELGMDIERRANLMTLRHDMLVAINGIDPRGHKVLTPDAPAEAEAAKWGKKARDFLKPVEDTKFRELFAAGKLTRVHVLIMPTAGASGSTAVSSAAGFPVPGGTTTTSDIQRVSPGLPNAGGLNLRHVTTYYEEVYLIEYTPYNDAHPKNFVKVSRDADGKFTRESHTVSGSWDGYAVEQVMSVDDALHLFASSTAAYRNIGATWLGQCEVDAGHRAQVLAALAGKLPDNDKRHVVFPAYCHWADASATSELVKGLDRSDDAPLAIETLLRIDPATAEKAVKARVKTGSPVGDALSLVASNDTPVKAAAENLKQRWREWEQSAEPVSVDVAIKQLAGGPMELPAALNALANARLSATDAPRVRAAILPLLRPNVGQPLEAQIIKVYAKVATKQDVEYLEWYAKKHAKSDDCLPAMAALVRLGSTTAYAALAEDAHRRDRLAECFDRATVDESWFWPLLKSDNAKVTVGGARLLQRFGSARSLPALQDAKAAHRPNDVESAVDGAIKTIGRRDKTR